MFDDIAIGGVGNSIGGPLIGALPLWIIAAPVAVDDHRSTRS
ncbi:MAG TPA: hypothetical protein VME67_25320 [Mycobacterium sp.]|nr:hypothetical protein [Mycobacterium sp.]HTX97864.1 hypothetical protein [Mycobacterium sp.]